jgi:hypothetical protein
VHIQWNSSSYEVKVINSTPNNYTGLTAKAHIYKPDGSEVATAAKTAQVDAPAGMPVTCFTLTKSVALPDVHFLKLVLTDSSDKVVSENWYLKGKKEYDYTKLKDIPKADLSVSVKSKTEDGKCVMDVAVMNDENSPALAHSVRLRVVNAVTGERILPVFLPDNYLLILPGETRHLQISFDAELLKGAEPRLLLKQFLQAEESFNVASGTRPVENLPYIKIHPNPAKGIFYIETNNRIDEVAVFNLAGRRVYAGTGKRINLKEFPKGIYFANIKTDRQIISKRVINL